MDHIVTKEKRKMKIIIEVEIWKDIPEYERLYMVSSKGRVMRLESLVNTKNGSKRKEKCKILKNGKNRNGYPKVALSKNGKVNYFQVHRLVAQAFLIIKGKQNQVNHKDGSRTNNHLDNLEWCTQSENTQHAWDMGAISKRKSAKVIKEL